MSTMQYKFNGGVHPFTFKSLASDRPIKKPFIPKKVVLPLLQHTGSPAEPVVAVGDTVKAGDLIAKPSGYISSAVHASVSGKVARMAYFSTYNQPRVLSVVIETDADAEQDFRMKPAGDPDTLSREEMIGRIRAAGVVGLGGAGFPTDVKLSPPANKPVDTVILNGAECEPYLTCDHRLMLEKTKEILKGLDIIVRILGAKQAYIAIENNKLSAIYAMEKALKQYSFRSLKTAKVISLNEKYPQGAEKQIIKVILNRVVPAGGLPMDVGCVANNVGTAYAVYEAVYFNKPLIERAITITGKCVKDPLNIWVRMGTLLSDLKGVFGGFTAEPGKVIMGGPMMGIAQYSMDVPISKGVGGIVFLTQEEIDPGRESVCIRCGRCMDACPIGLVPTTLMYRVKKENFSEAKELGIMNCYECGACAYTCPAKIPLVDYMKFGKARNQVI
ncbi:MAG: electron transport complex subunit RsxC [Candidatus Omnitrophica bacterium]|nr:electron transport complex subunit RsxC [Candidatus Omnitrophota bacterium]